jgi:hypothetical protein
MYVTNKGVSCCGQTAQHTLYSFVNVYHRFGITLNFHTQDEKNQAGNILWQWPAKSGYSKVVKRAQSDQWEPYATERENHSVEEERKFNFTDEDKGKLRNGVTTHHLHDRENQSS